MFHNFLNRLYKTFNPHVISIIPIREIGNGATVLQKAPTNKEKIATILDSILNLK